MDERLAARLIVRVPGVEPATVPLKRGVLTVGRDRKCDITLQSPYVSRVHARLEKQGDSHFIVDEGSRNRTLVNGREISTSTRLSHGDEIRIANVEMWYMLDVAPDQPTPLWPETSRPKGGRTGLLLSVDESTHRVWIEGQKAEISLSPLEFKLLHFLYSRSGTVCSRDEIGAAVWGQDRYDYDMLYRLVQRVKEKIEGDPSNPQYIISHRGIGYTLNV